MEETYYRIQGTNGAYILTRKEFENALDRENEGVEGKILKEDEYYA